MGNKKDMMKKIKSALVSVSDKSNLKPLLQILKKNKVKIISSGGTFKTIKRLKFDCSEVSDFTGFKEILGGRVKTLHPKIHAGILSKRNNKLHQKQLKSNKFENIDLVIVNFYPFEKTLEKTKKHEKILENIDIGGPAMVRASAKNYSDVTVITSIKQYPELIDQLKVNKGSTTLKFRKDMSQLAFGETAYYDSVISNYFNLETKTYFPQKKIFYGNLIEKLRYGENPHQESAIYSQNQNLGINKIHGKSLSYNNYNDIFSALTISKSLPQNTGTVIVKHANPCGVSILKNNINSYKSALACDPLSAFGGVISCNFKVTKKKPSKTQFNDLIFAFNVCRYVKSNAIVLASNKTTIGIGSGQPSRLDSCHIAIDKMKKFTISSSNIVAASDAFFPFIDGLEKLVQSGVKAVVQPAVSIRDKEIIKFANDIGIVLVFSKTRHFRH